ncbi:hypothetical protein ACRAWG_14120 [Methylobacterium sp. P31]
MGDQGRLVLARDARGGIRPERVPLAGDAGDPRRIRGSDCGDDLRAQIAVDEGPQAVGGIRRALRPPSLGALQPVGPVARDPRPRMSKAVWIG